MAVVGKNVCLRNTGPKCQCHPRESPALSFASCGQQSFSGDNSALCTLVTQMAILQRKQKKVFDSCYCVKGKFIKQSLSTLLGDLQGRCKTCLK